MKLKILKFFASTLILIICSTSLSATKKILITFKNGKTHEYNYSRFNANNITIIEDGVSKDIPMSSISSFKPQRNIGAMVNFNKVIISGDNAYYGYLLKLDNKNIFVGDKYTNYRIPLKNIDQTLDYEQYDSYINMSRLGSMWRSAIFPGWGQIYNNRDYGIIYSVLFTGSLFSSFYCYTQKENYDAQYSGSKYTDIGAYDSAKKWEQYMMYSLYAAASVWTINILDATLFYENKYESLKDKTFHGIGIKIKF